MFGISVLDNNGQEIKPSLKISSSPAEYYAGCLAFLIELLNGGSNLNLMFKQLDKGAEFGTSFMKQTAQVMFISQLHQHPSFSAEVCFDKKNPNYLIFHGIASLLNVPVNDTSNHIPFLELVTQMKVEGISSISYTTQFTKNHETLYQCNFPDDFIPDEYLCVLSSQIMDTPVYDTRTTNTFFDKNKFNESVKEKGVNPYTQVAVTAQNIVVDESLKNKIENFMAKVISIPKNFPTDYNEIYVKFKADIQSELSLEDFKVKLLSEKIKLQNMAQDKISTKALIQKLSKNPFQLYQSAIQAYKEKNYNASVQMLTQALSLFEMNKGMSIEPQFKCHSTLISNYRDLKNYDQAIQCSEMVITQFSSQFDISSVIKKYHECLELRGDKMETVYDRAVMHYKDKQYNIALQELLFIKDKYDLNKQQPELATCYSTLASCYRELGQFELAIESCEQAVKLRKQCLKPDDKKIQEAELKLESINKLASESIKQGKSFM
ncbi:MAG: hypothetical protein Q8M40_02530 [Legionella sp.]|nr:hypothetical protein [Legionella sp.]